MDFNTTVDVGMALVMIVAGALVPIFLVAIVWSFVDRLEKRLDRMEQRIDALVNPSINPTSLSARSGTEPTARR